MKKMKPLALDIELIDKDNPDLNKSEELVEEEEDDDQDSNKLDLNFIDDQTFKLFDSKSLNEFQKPEVPKNIKQRNFTQGE